MTYVYDIVLNFHHQLYEFYEWNKDDKITHIKRINLIKINSKVFNDIINNDIKVEDDLLLSIFNKCEYFDNRNTINLPYALLVTDSYRVMAIEFDLEGNINKYSSLLLDEEEDVLNISKRLPCLKIKYQIIKKKMQNKNYTRLDNYVISYIKKDLNTCYQENNTSKLKYLYYEYFNKPEDNIEKIYHGFLKELVTVNEKVYELYSLIKLSYNHKNV